MMAMTMAFDVADPHLLEGLAPDQAVEFTVEPAAGRYRILAIAGRDG
jgi:Cu/Ag efflux protein CusF